MPNYNPLQKYIRTLQPLHPGKGRSLGLPIEGITDCEHLKSLMEAGEGAGHWIITRRPIGRFGYKLTAEGAAFLSEDPGR